MKFFNKLFGKSQKEVALHSEPLTETAIRQWLVNRIAEIAQVPQDQVDVDRPFAEFGLDSLQLFEISGDLEKFLGQKVSEIVAWDYPTVAKLSRYLSAPESEASASSVMVAHGEGSW